MTATTTNPTRYRALTWAPVAVLAWTLTYGAIRVYWAAGHMPTFAPMPEDLVIFPGWGAVGLCVAAGLAAVGLRLSSRSRLVLAGAWATVAAIVVASPMFLLDVVGGILAGLGIPVSLVSVASRGGMLLGAGLLAVAAVAYQRRLRGACSRCGRLGRASDGPADARERSAPAWAVWAAYVAVAGCLVRIAAQLAWGFEGFLYDGGAALLVFEVGFVLAGVLLPTALVHRFGLVWPRWVLPLAGRRVPRWLVLGPAFFVGLGLTVYFGMGLAQLVVDTVSGAAFVDDGSGYGAGFMWIAVPSYFVWGVGVGVAALARFRQTRPRCRHCGQLHRAPVNPHLTRKNCRECDKSGAIGVARRTLFGPGFGKNENRVQYKCRGTQGRHHRRDAAGEGRSGRHHRRHGAP
ncbi:hypothetical protein [Stackebrandtia nassauensis]|uniref:Uncharacterized protein n=1 Tax=Stackebrandtia nassauensis (strain DSM 44728 / CIP 108903 / NRRL B-16338 / NBRC 102104 / LLR-40K-21) TaxID=446470 RepID=D3PWE3_STANL|nr:hypothetical protein [Stackebrandtia nassauensis]ADD41300.1 hypothetical protein Snas_1597 [Stackebrandtia nassauensis DSM 44728]